MIHSQIPTSTQIAVVADPVMYRFPIVLEALDDAVAAYAEDVTKLNTSTMPVILQSHHDLEDLSKELGRTFRPDYQMPEPVLPGYVKDMLVIDDDTNMEDGAFAAMRQIQIASAIL